MDSETFSALLTVIDFLENCTGQLLEQLSKTAPKNHDEMIVKAEHMDSLKEIVKRTILMKNNLFEISASGEGFGQEIDNPAAQFSELNLILEQLYSITDLHEPNNLCVDKDGKLTK